MRLHVHYSARGRGLGALVMSWKYVEGSDMHIAFHTMRKAGEQLFWRAVEHGDVREGLELIDAPRLIWGMQISATRESAPPERIDAMFDIVIAGLRPHT